MVVSDEYVFSPVAQSWLLWRCIATSCGSHIIMHAWQGHCMSAHVHVQVDAFYCIYCFL